MEATTIHPIDQQKEETTDCTTAKSTEADSFVRDQQHQ